MKIIKGVAPPPTRRTYNFDKLRIGDAIDVESYGGCREMFRRWKIERDRSDVALKYMGRSPENRELYRFFFTGVEKKKGP